MQQVRLVVLYDSSCCMLVAASKLTTTPALLLLLLMLSTGGVRTGGYPKTAPVSGPLGFQRPGDWDLLWSPARSALKAVPNLKAGQLVSAVPGMYSLTKKVQGSWKQRAGQPRKQPPTPASTNTYVPVAAVLLFVMCSAA